MAAASVAALPPGFKFDPDDDVLVAHYLLPRLRGQPLPFDGIIIEDDPLSAPPWKLVDKYQRKGDTFFFAAAQARSCKGSRKKRTCAGGGFWEGQGKKTSVDGEKLRVPGTGEEIAWYKYALNFHADGENGSTGWVMHEYAITAPAKLASSPLRAYRIRFSGHGKKRKRAPQDSDADDAGARSAPRRTTAEAALPPSASESAHDEPLFFVDDFTLPAPAMEDFSAAAAASLELPDDMDELLHYFTYNDLSVPEPCSQQAAYLGGDIISPAAATMSERIGAPPSDEGSCTAVMDFEMPESIDEMLHYFTYDD